MDIKAMHGWTVKVGALTAALVAALSIGAAAPAMAAVPGGKIQLCNWLPNYTPSVWVNTQSGGWQSAGVALHTCQTFTPPRPSDRAATVIVRHNTENYGFEGTWYWDTSFGFGVVVHSDSSFETYP